MLNNQHTPNAHVTIQSVGRMYLSTLKVKRGLKAATVIQSLGRMHVAKASLKRNRKAAIVIQCMARILISKNRRRRRHRQLTIHPQLVSSHKTMIIAWKDYRKWVHGKLSNQLHLAATIFTTRREHQRDKKKFIYQIFLQKHVIPTAKQRLKNKCVIKMLFSMVLCQLRCNVTQIEKQRRNPFLGWQLGMTVSFLAARNNEWKCN